MVEAVEQYPGGNAANTSIALGKLGAPVRILSLCGADAAAVFVRGHLESAGADCSGIFTTQSPTSTAVMLIHPRGERAIYYHLGASGDPFPEHLPLEGGAHFHLAATFRMPDLRKRAPAILAQAQTLGMSTSIDTQWDTDGLWMATLAPALPYCDTLFVNQREMAMLTGSTDISRGAQALAERGPAVIVVKLGDQGCLLRTGSEEAWIAGIPVRAVDTTGAGDCFVAGFLAARWRGENILESARFANAVGALAVTEIGATKGLRGFEETLSFRRSFCS